MVGYQSESSNRLRDLFLLDQVARVRCSSSLALKVV
jgi:hypothetical protein